MTFAKPTISEAHSHRSLNCSAHDCPHPWSVDAPQAHMLCSYHAWAPINEWPRITNQLLQDIASNFSRPKAVASHVTAEEKRAILQSLSSTLKARQFDPTDGKAWAKRLKARHERGERLNSNQVLRYRAALSLEMSTQQLEAA